MQISLLLLIYSLNVLVVAFVLLWSFFSDHSTPKDHTLSWVIIAIASIFWFIAVPVSMLETLRKSTRYRRTVQAQIRPSKT
jgi:hypothetical protein